MNYQNLSYKNRGLLLGVLLSLILILISSYQSPIANYENGKKIFNDYETLANKCGTNSSRDCVLKLCSQRIVENSCNGGMYMQSYLTYMGQPVCNEGYCAVLEDANKNGSDLFGYAGTKAPSILRLIKPNIVDGLESFLMFGIFGLIFLIIFPLLGFIIGFIYEKLRRK